jgi:hypothetical protein
MKKIFFILLTSLGPLALMAQVPKKSVVEHFTNSNCSVCASRNPGFYANLNRQANVLHLAVHPSSPYSSCRLYQQNDAANDARTNYYGIYGGTPRLVINGSVIPSGNDYAANSLFTPFINQTSPVSIRIEQRKFGVDSVQSKIIIKTVSANNLNSASLFVSLAENTVNYSGNNGESIHYDVFRKSLTAATGQSITIPRAIGDSVVVVLSSPSNAVWNFNKIYTLAILQETASKSLIQAEASSVYTLENAQAIKFDKPQIFPNPVESILNLQFKGSEPTTCALFDLSGVEVLKKELNNQQEVSLNLSSLASGIYTLKVTNKDGSTCFEKIAKQ